MKHEVEKANQIRLNKLSGVEVSYESYDFAQSEFEKNRLDSVIMAQKKLKLKLNAQVMLIKNLTSLNDGLVNGAIGVVIGFVRSSDIKDTKIAAANMNTKFTTYPKVRFQDGTIAVISPEKSTIEHKDVVLAYRDQVT